MNMYVSNQQLLSLSLSDLNINNNWNFDDMNSVRTLWLLPIQQIDSMVMKSKMWVVCNLFGFCLSSNICYVLSSITIFDSTSFVMKQILKVAYLHFYDVNIFKKHEMKEMKLRIGFSQQYLEVTAWQKRNSCV